MSLRIRLVVPAALLALALAGCTQSVTGSGGTDDTAGASTSASAVPSDSSASSTPESSTPESSNPASSSAGAETTPGAGSAGLTRTEQVTVNPVRRDGTPAPGWTVVERAQAVSCSRTADLDPDVDVIHGCGSTADGLPACWLVDSGAAALCANNPFDQTLTRVPVSGVSVYDAPAHEGIDGAQLADGTELSTRFGAGNAPTNGKSHDYTDMYLQVDNSSSPLVIWGIYDSGFDLAFDRSKPVWTAEVGGWDGPDAVAQVQAVYSFGPKA